MISLYISTHTWLHRWPAALKLSILVLGSMFCLSAHEWRWLLVGIVGLGGVYVSLGGPGRKRLIGLKSFVPLIAGLGLFQGLVMDWHLAMLSATRLLFMIMLADLVTVTTPMQNMLRAVAPILRPLRHFGLNPEKLALAVALVIRFIPLLLNQWQAQREAFMARSGRRPGLRLLIPFMAQALRRTDQIAESITARQADRRPASH